MATATINTTDFAEFIEPKHRNMFYDAYYNEVELGYKGLFKEQDMGKPTETYFHSGAFGRWGSNTEGSPLNVSTMSVGEEVEYTAVRYDNSYIVTHEMMNDDLQGVFGGQGKIGDSVINNAPELLGRGCRDMEDSTCAAILTGGFGNTGYDGVALFSNSHTLVDSSATKDNLASGALTPENLKDAITLMRSQTTNEAGIKTVAKPHHLIVPPGLEWAALEIISSFKQAGEMSNTENVIPKLKVKVYDRLEDTGDTYATTNWFLKSDSIENLLMNWKEYPFFGTKDINGSLDYQCFGYARFVPAYVNWRGLVGSTGV